MVAHMVAKHVKSEEWKYAPKGISWWWIFDPLEQPYGMEQAPKAHAYATANKRLRDAQKASHWTDYGVDKNFGCILYAFC